jgi:hypothetical protein
VELAHITTQDENYGILSDEIYLLQLLHPLLPLLEAAFFVPDQASLLSTVSD